MSRREDRDRAERAERAERERERERELRRSQAPATARKNEYFLPKEGIDREVITADICRYLGNDALVRPGGYVNPQTGQTQQGYLISAYRNLTSAMIVDLKADSARWEAERRATASGARASNAPEYRTSQIHQSRQHYGPSEPAAGITPGGYPPSSGAQQGTVYDSGPQYHDQQYGQPASGYIQPQQDYPIQQDSNYYFGGALRPQEVPGSRQGRGVPVTQAPSGSVLRDQYSTNTPTYQQQADPRYTGYSQPPPVSQPSYVPQQQQPIDSSYRGAPYDQSDYNNPYDYSDPSRGYGEPSGYGSQSMTPSSTTSSTTITAEPPRRRDGGRDPRDSRHHRTDRRN